MRKILNQELTKLFLFILLSFLGAALLAPQLYGWGKDLATTHGPFTSDPIFWESPKVWLAEKCNSAKFSRFFNRSLYICALILLFPLIKSLKAKDGVTEKKPFFQRITPKQCDIKNLLFGIFVSAGFLTLLSFLLYQLGWTQPDDKFDLFKAFRKAIAPAILASLIEELLFRGVLFDLLRRQLSPTKTIVGLSLFFAALHFMQPPKGGAISDPRSITAGFEMLGLIGQKFLTLDTFIGVFLTLFMVGAILAYTRHRTGKLWLAIGLHAGWVFSLKFTNRLFDSTDTAPALLYNGSITDGMLPLLTLSLTGVCVHYYLSPRKTCPEKS